MAGYSDIAKTLPGGGVGIPSEWKQGRTAYGGLTAALCVEAAMSEIADLPPLRSLQINFTGPVMGDPEFGVDVLRRGRNVTSMAVKARVEGQAVGNALLVFGAARESVLSVDVGPPDGVAALADSDGFFPEAAQAFAPAFFHNFEVRLAGGHRPISGASEGRVLAWARHKDAASREGLAAFVCLGDVLPPAAFPMMRQMVPISSVNWMLNMLRAPETEEGWFLIESHQSAAREGYSSQRMRLWNTAGELVAEGLQAVAVFG